MSKLLESIKIKAKLLQKAKAKTQPEFKLKSAYEILAKAAGFSSWREWKPILQEHSLYAPPGGSLWHVWYSDYEKALKHLREKPECYLIPFQKHFFVCDENYILFLGLQVEEKDLSAVGHNWVEPQDAKAWARLLKKIKPRA